MSDTIFALASAPGKAGVSIFRISGSGAQDIAVKLCGNVPICRGLRVLRYNETVLDKVLVLSFKQGASFTGEDVIEFHCHGSPAVVATISDSLSAVGARLADPGEFTRRALQNERLDLCQVEGLSDLIEAETEVQRRQAYALMDGGLTDKVDRWRANLVRATALVEVTIDFVD